MVGVVVVVVMGGGDGVVTVLIVIRRHVDHPGGDINDGNLDHPAVCLIASSN